MRALVTLSVALGIVGNARAETVDNPCRGASWQPNNYIATTLSAVPTRPNIIVPVQLVQDDLTSSPLDLVAVQVFDAHDQLVPGELSSSTRAADRAAPIWRPTDALIPGSQYSMTYEVIASSDSACYGYQAFNGTVTFAIATEPPAVAAALTIEAAFVDQVINRDYGLSASCGPGATPCAARPGICCVRDSLGTERRLELVATASGITPRQGYYTLNIQATSPDLGVWEAEIYLDPEVSTSISTMVEREAPPPAEGTGCVTASLIDLLANETIATVAQCADPNAYAREPDTDCDNACLYMDGPNLNAEDVNVADPSPSELTSEPQTTRGDEGCGGAPLTFPLALLCLALPRRRRAIAA